MVMDRRQFIKWGTVLGLGPIAHPVFARKNILRRGGELELLNTARNCIFVNLLGAPSQMDTFDYKTGSWTLPETESVNLNSGAAWPVSFMPNLLSVQDKFSLVRSLYTTVVNHQRAQYRVETAHPFVAAKVLQEEIPPLGTLFSLELDRQRASTDIYPSFVSLDYRPKGTGMVDNRFAAFTLSGSLGRETFEHPAGKGVLNKRLDLLNHMDPRKSAGTSEDPSSVSYLWEQASLLMSDDRVVQALDLDEETKTRYGGNYGIGKTLAQAYQLLAQDAGARFISIGDDGWDHHASIKWGIPSKTRSLDLGLSALINDLSTTPGSQAGKSLLDETLIIVTGEFGRTPGDLNASGGRDHHGGAYAALLAGGGVQGGRFLGETDSIGDQIIDNGWSHNRALSTSDLAATALSALGIQPNTRIEDTPSGRPFYYTSSETWMNTDPTHILELFQ